MLLKLLLFFQLARLRSVSAFHPKQTSAPQQTLANSKEAAVIDFALSGMRHPH